VEPPTIPARSPSATSLYTRPASTRTQTTPRSSARRAPAPTAYLSPSPRRFIILMATTAAAAIRSPTRAAAPGPAAPAQQRAVLRVASSRTSSARPRRAAAAVAAAAMQPAKAVAAEAASPAAVEMGNGAAAPGLQRPDAMGRFGRFGGKYVPETLMHALTELESAFHALATDDEFQVALPLPLPLLCGYVPCLRLIVDSVLAGIWMPSFFFVQMPTFRRYEMSHLMG
jgi:hypothetical protein